MPFIIPYDKLHPEIAAALPKAIRKRRPIFVCEPLKAQEMAVIVSLERWLHIHNGRDTHSVRTAVTDRHPHDRLNWPSKGDRKRGEART